MRKNLLTINHKQLEKLIIKAYHTKKPLYVTGGIGIGKSHVIRDTAKKLAKELGMEFKDTKQPNNYLDCFCRIDQRMAEKDPSDVLGLPETYAITLINGERMYVPVKSLATFIEHNEECKILNYTTRWNTPNWLPLEGCGIIHLDELNLAPSLVQNACYELIYDRCVGDWIMPDGYIAIGSGNRGMEDRAFTTEMAGPLQDRFLNCELQIPSVEDWTSWALTRKYEDGKPHPIDHRIIAYLNAKQSSIYTFNPKSKERAFSTPRSWEYSSDLIEGITNFEDIQLYLSSSVGTYIAGEFINFMRMTAQIPAITQYIKSPNKTEIPESNDLLYSLCVSLAEYFRTHKKKSVLTSIVIVSKRLRMEFTTFLLKMCKLTHEDYFKQNMPEIKEAKDLLYKIGKYLL